MRTVSQTQTDSPRQGYLSVNEFAQLLGVHPQTVRAWDKNGTFPAHHRTPGGQRRYTREQAERILSGQVPIHTDGRDEHGQD